ncbi:hypothetical protein GP486_001499, partial [Trichoglossum hirsutum]
MSSLDGVMELSEHYITDSKTGEILRPKKTSRILSGNALKGCPYCRMPVGEIERYNRIIKRALLDEATRRFVMHANAQCAELVVEIGKGETELERGTSVFTSHEPDEVRDFDTALKTYQLEVHKLLKRIRKFTKFVEKTEQPFGKVNQLFVSAVAKRQDIATDAFELDESVIQTGFQLRAQSFRLRVNWALLWNLDTIACTRSIGSCIRGELRTKISKSARGLMDDCASLITASQTAKLPQHEVEARIYHAQFSMLSLSNTRELGNSTEQHEEVNTAAEIELRKRENESLETCEVLCENYPGSLGYLRNDIEKAKKLVNGGTTYTFVTTDEKREVYRAMASQFSGTGHWYYCRNGHPVRKPPHRYPITLWRSTLNSASANDVVKSTQFTVGECGMPMQEARCPQCEAPVGGLDHDPAPGVHRAEGWDAQFGRD